MDKNDLNKPMSGWDWQVLAHQYEKNGKITLPRCRLDVPLPSTLNECHTLAHRLAALSRSEEHTSELQSLMRISYAVFCLKKKKQIQNVTSLTSLSRHPIHTPIYNEN